jgi:hypothetical protein
VCRRLGVFAATALVAALLVVPSGGAAPHMLVGLLDETHTLYGNPDQSFPIMKQLRVQVLRVNLYWGGKFAVAKRRPTDGTDPADPAYDWSLYDRLAQYAAQYKVKLLFTIWGTPGWANRRKGANYAPKNFRDLQDFAYAAATRYSGDFIGDDGRTLPAVRLWTAWNEPNEPFELAPQYKRVAGRWVIQSAIDYAKICNAVYTGVHSTMNAGEKVACGVTSPRGNNNPSASRSTIDPLAFLRACKKAGLRRFDAWAHHPYYGQPNETPTTPPPGGRAVTLGNINTLITELTRLYGRKRVWITEYGYQTNPPDRTFGVSWTKQSRYLTQAFAIARKNPRIDMMLWFLLKDEPVLSGWQSGLMTAGGRKKPAFTAFMHLPH